MFNNKGEEKRETGKSENAKCRGVFRILSNILLAVTPIIVFEIVQMITVLSVRYKMSQLRTVRQIVTRLFSMEMKYQLYNLVIYYALFAVMILIFRKAKVAAVVYTVALVTAALVNYYVIMFRGQPFMLLDIVGGNSGRGRRGISVPDAEASGADDGRGIVFPCDPADISEI